jgi:hypothetical protein
VNDRPYVASSFVSVAIAPVYGTALQGRCQDRPELAATPSPLSARLDVLPVRGGERFLRSVSFQVLSQPRPAQAQTSKRISLLLRAGQIGCF